MTSLAAVILAHRDAPQVRRLIGALDGLPITVHCDVKAPAAVAAEMMRDWDGRVQATPRRSGALASWSLMRIEIELLRAAVRQSAAEHIVVMSGSDYPLVGMAELERQLAAWSGRSYLFNAAIPYDSWSVPRHPDGGAWRFQHRFLTRHDDVISVRGVPLRLPWRRPAPTGLALRASHAWKIISRADAERVLHVVDTRPDIVQFWRHTFIPEESFIASVLSSPELTGAPALPLCHRIPWFMRWSARGSHHPEWLNSDDFEAIALAAQRPAGTPENLTPVDAPAPRPLFARKVSTDISAGLLDRIDAELR